MAQRAEQISREPFPVPPKSKRYFKRVFARKRRREARRDPESAITTRRYDGWYY